VCGSLLCVLSFSSLNLLIFFHAPQTQITFTRTSIEVNVVPEREINIAEEQDHFGSAKSEVQCALNVYVHASSIFVCGALC